MLRVLHELLGQLAKVDLTLVNSPVSAAALGELIDAVSSRKLTGKEFPPVSASSLTRLLILVMLWNPAGTAAKSILRDFLSAPKSSSLKSLIQRNSSSGLTSTVLESLCQAVIVDLPVEADIVRQGQRKVLMRLVGEVMKRSKGQADAKKVTDMLNGMLK